jgi:RNA polymerase sigma-70 factor, ECF subfamily
MPRKRFSITSPPALETTAVAGDAEFNALDPERRMVDEFFSAAYEELLRIATAVRKRDGRAELSPSTLVNEAWLKLSSSHGLAFESPLHFKLTAARAMRQTLVEAARRRDSEKRGGSGEVVFVTFDDFVQPVRCDREIMALHESLNELARLSERQAKLVELRYFGGMNVSETAILLGISEATVLRDWRAAKAWLGSELRQK